MDYDVGVTGLSSPPAAAVVTNYRPAILVRNNGIHNAIASGYLRIYSAGLMVFETEVFSGTLTPGQTGTADAVDYWTPPAEGPYVVQGYVSTPLDMVEPNNNLNPVTIIVKGGPVPPPPPVALHASQHEEGGTDQVNVDGLPGVLRDKQLPSNHAAQHQAGQPDVMNVAGLAGILGEPQTPTAHGNAHHSPAMATAAELSSHAGGTSAHNAATNLEKVANRGAPLGYCPLNSGSVVEPTYIGQHDSGRHALGTISPALPGYANSEGSTLLLPRADHRHAASGEVFKNASQGDIGPGQSADSATFTVPAAYTGGKLRLSAWGQASAASPTDMTFELWALGLLTGDELLAYITVPIPGGTTDAPILVEAAVNMVDVHLDGWIRATLSALPRHSTAATIYLDNRVEPFYNERADAPLVCKIRTTVGSVPGAYLHQMWADVQFDHP